MKPKSKIDMVIPSKIILILYLYERGYYMIIYKAVNKINGMIYIGQTIKSLKQRKAQHELESFNQKCFHWN